MFNWEINEVREANTLPSTVWSVWKDVPNWPTWDSDLEWSRLNGAFAEGATGVLKPKGWFSSNRPLSKLA